MPWSPLYHGGCHELPNHSRGSPAHRVCPGRAARAGARRCRSRLAPVAGMPRCGGSSPPNSRGACGGLGGGALSRAEARAESRSLGLAGGSRAPGLAGVRSARRVDGLGAAAGLGRGRARRWLRWFFCFRRRPSRWRSLRSRRLRPRLWFRPPSLRPARLSRRRRGSFSPRAAAWQWSGRWRTNQSRTALVARVRAAVYDAASVAGQAPDAQTLARSVPAAGAPVVAVAGQGGWTPLALALPRPAFKRHPGRSALRHHG